MATEAEYDEIIAPMLLAVASRCKELGMSLVARVEWSPEESGITQTGVEDAGIGESEAFKLADLRIFSSGLPGDYRILHIPTRKTVNVMSCESWEDALQWLQKYVESDEH